jgi:hypothetical protein
VCRYFERGKLGKISATFGKAARFSYKEKENFTKTEKLIPPEEGKNNQRRLWLLKT